MYSFFINVGYWIKHLPEMNDACEAMGRIHLETLNDVRELMSRFKWVPDSYFDWRPWVVTMVNRDLRDDCDGAAVLGKWALKKIGIKARIVELWNTEQRTGHAICMSNDNRIMISNENVKIFPGNNWKKQAMEFHNNAFNKIG